MTKTFNILDAEIGDPDDGIRELIISDIYTDTVTFKDGHSADKVFLKCKTIDGEREFQISEAWNDSRRGKKVQGLWIQLGSDKKLIANSTLGKLLAYHKAATINDLQGKKVTGYPDTNGYVVLTTYDKETEKENIESIFDS